MGKRVISFAYTPSEFRGKTDRYLPYKQKSYVVRCITRLQRGFYAHTHTPKNNNKNSNFLVSNIYVCVCACPSDLIYYSFVLFIIFVLYQCEYTQSFWARFERWLKEICSGCDRFSIKSTPIILNTIENKNR